MNEPQLPRVSAVSYLNTRPLVWGLLHGPEQGRFDLRFELPSACARSIESAEADIGLVPTVELFRQGLEIFSDVCISSDGPVRSIFLLHRTPLKQIRSVALDSSSRTSVALAKIVLAERYGVRAEERECPPDIAAMLAESDAAILIGDPALRLDPHASGFEALDLGSEWLALTGLPMVFAVWAGRPAATSLSVSATFRDSYEYGRTRINEIVNLEAPPRQVPGALAYRYLTEHIRYDLSPRTLQGLQEFKRLAAAHGLL